MTLQTQLIDVKFDQGVDTREDGFLRTGSFDEMVNVEIQKAGGVVKRNGFDMVPQTGLSGTVLKICELENYLMAITTTGIYRYITSTSSWVYVGVGPSIDVQSIGYPFSKSQTPICITYSNSKWIALAFDTVNGVDGLYILELGVDFKTILSSTRIAEPNIAYTFEKSGYAFSEMDNGNLAIGFNLRTSSTKTLAYLYIINGTSVDSVSQLYDSVITSKSLKSVCSYGPHVFASVAYFSSGFILVGVEKILIGSGSQAVVNSTFVSKVAALSLDIGQELLGASFANASYFCIGDQFSPAANSVVGNGYYYNVSNAAGSGTYTIKRDGVLIYTGTNCTVPVNLTYSLSDDLVIDGSFAYGSWPNLSTIEWECNVGKVILRRSGLIYIVSSTVTASLLSVISATNSLASIAITNSTETSNSGSYGSSEITGTYFYFYGTNITGQIGTRIFQFEILSKVFTPSYQYSYMTLIYKSLYDVMFYDDKAKSLILSNSSFQIRAALLQGNAQSYLSMVSRYNATLGIGKDSSSQEYNYAIIRHPAITTPDQLMIAQETKGVFFTGGFLGEFSTQESSEVGFFQLPFVYSSTLDIAGGGSLSAGTYFYAFTFSYIDSSGNKEESEPYFIKDGVVVTGSSKANSFNVTTLQLTNRDTIDCRLNTYRTKANESIFYKIYSQSFTSTSKNVMDTLANSSITDQEILYTTGGILPNSAIGACFTICATKNRLFVASSEDRTKIFFSKEKLTGYGFEFNGLQYIDCNGGQFEGEITALCGLDEKIIIGKDKYLLGISGDGPNAAGGGSDFSIPVSISTDVGISDKNSIVVMPDGLMFKSKKGIYLISRGLQVSYIGLLADKYSQNTVYSSMMTSVKNLIFFGLVGQVLVYDYLLKLWFTWKGQIGLVDAVSCCLINDVPYLLTSGGRILKQNATYLDQLTLTPTTENIITEIETSWLEAGKISGFQRIRRIMLLGRGYGAASFDIKVMRDYDMTVLETHILGITETAGAKVQVSMHLANQKSATTKINIKETGTGTANKISLSGMTYELGLKKGTSKVPSTRKI
jgi:hypothetical protein